MGTGRRAALPETLAMVDALPEAARDQLGVEMAIVGREILAAQRADAPEDTGKLRGSLGLQLVLDRLKVRIGLLKRFWRANAAYYGRFVNFGRHAQVVVVTRRIKQRLVRQGRTDGRFNSSRQVEYQGASDRLRRRGPNKGTPIGSPYKLSVKFRAAHPFVDQPLLAEAAELRAADFWAGVLDKANAT